jgi:hypothetical protein
MVGRLVAIFVFATFAEVTVGFAGVLIINVKTGKGHKPKEDDQDKKGLQKNWMYDK